MLRKFLRGWGLAAFSLNRYKVAHTLLGKSCILCFKTVLGMNKITPTTFPTPHRKLQNLQIFF